MSRKDTFGDHLTLQAASNLYQVQFTVVSSLGHDGEVIVTPQFSSPVAHFTLGHFAETEGIHYVWLPAHDSQHNYEPGLQPEPQLEREPALQPEPQLEREPALQPEPQLEREPEFQPEPLLEREPGLQPELAHKPNLDNKNNNNFTNILNKRTTYR